jgi:predicted O-methyltransferase YrrM
MSQERWSAVDAYFTDTLITPDAPLEAALQASDAAGLPNIAVSPNQGKLLQLLVQMMGARRVLEIGTLGGYSTICLARGVGAGGFVLSLELSAHHAQVARNNVEVAGLADLVQIRVGKAVDTLRALIDEGTPPFDFIFIDADKPSNPDYLQLSLKLSRPGTVIVVDNVVRDGAVVEADSPDPAVLGVRKLCERVGADPWLAATAIQTVGLKGYDGFLIARVGDSQ